MKTLIKKAIPAFMVVFLTACGGSDDNDQDNKALAYKGITAPVVLTEGNKKKVASELIKFIKQYSVYNALDMYVRNIHPSYGPFYCEDGVGVTTKYGYGGNLNEIELVTYKYDECLIDSYHKSSYLVVSGESKYSKAESNSLISGVEVYGNNESNTTDFDVTIKGVPGKVKVIVSWEELNKKFYYSGVDEVKDDDIVEMDLYSTRNSISNSSYRVETSFFSEEIDYYEDGSSYTEGNLFKFNGGETVRFTMNNFEYEYSGLDGLVNFNIYSIGLPSVGILSGYIYGAVGLCSSSSDLGYDSAYKNDFAAGTIVVNTEDKSLKIDYVGCGEYTVTLGDPMPM